MVQKARNTCRLMKVIDNHGIAARDGYQEIVPRIGVGVDRVLRKEDSPCVIE